MGDVVMAVVVVVGGRGGGGGGAMRISMEMFKEERRTRSRSHDDGCKTMFEFGCGLVCE